jgi:hypothetical protein
MKLQFNDLAAMQPLARVAVLSLAPGFYQLQVKVDSLEQPVWDTDGHLFTRRNLNAVREALAGLAITELVLRQESAYDEMIGQPLRKGSNALEVPLAPTVYPTLER